MSFEVIDALFNPGCYDTVYPYSYLFTWFVTIPHSLLTQLAFPADNAKFGELPFTLEACPNMNQLPAMS